ncbi:MAG TPA: M50 family metallopeptidase, partial [Thermoanaerobaculia bacterium]|nr:M50 family metallopeptidase [Thermoanaerobaculia bacterium]
TLVAGLALGGGLFWLAGKAGAGWIVFTVHLLAVMAALTAFSDLWTLIHLSGTDVECDARAMAAVTFLPAIFWAIAWALVASLLVGAAAWHAWRRSD